MKRMRGYHSMSWMFVAKVLTINVLCVHVLVKILKYSMEPEVSFGLADDMDLSEITLFEPWDVQDFPRGTSQGQAPRIPRILHQTWKDINIPTQFHDNIRSFVANNPDFEYFFWTDSSARKLIRDKFPHLLETFDNYVEPVRKADMLRYAVLYEFGGVYADLDTTCLRPLERVLHKYACVISPEPYEHSALIYNSVFLVTNSVLFCRAGHPFFKMVLDALPSFSHFSQDIDATGPNFLTYQYNVYRNDIKHTYLANSARLDEGKRKSSIFARRINDTTSKSSRTQINGLLDESHDDFVFVPSSQYFQNNLDPVRFDQFKSMCKNFMNLNSIAKRGCVSLRLHGMKVRRSQFEYTRHSFSHTGYKWVPSSEVTIHKLVEKAKIYN